MSSTRYPFRLNPLALAIAHALQSGLHFARG